MKNGSGKTTHHAGLRIVRAFDCIDLRTITSQSNFLQEQIKKYHLQHMDAILYTNSAITRFRLIFNAEGLGYLVIPECDEVSKHSLYLRISEHLSKLAGATHVVVNIDDIKKKIRERIQRQEEREQARAEKEIQLKKAS